MDNLLYIALLVGTVIFIVLALFSISALVKVSKFLDKTTVHFENLSTDISELKQDMTSALKEIVDLKEQVSTTLADAHDLKEQASVTLQGVDRMRDELSDASLGILSKVEGYVDALNPYKELVEDTYYKIAPSISNVAKTVNAFSKGLSVFKKRISNDKSSDKKYY